MHTFLTSAWCATKTLRISSKTNLNEFNLRYETSPHQRERFFVVTNHSCDTQLLHNTLHKKRDCPHTFSTPHQTLSIPAKNGQKTRVSEIVHIFAQDTHFLCKRYRTSLSKKSHTFKSTAKHPEKGRTEDTRSEDKTSNIQEHLSLINHCPKETIHSS